MNNEQLQAAKDQATREYGYSDWEDLIFYNSLSSYINRAMEIYAEMRVKKVLDILEANNPTIQQFKTTKP